MPQGGGAIGIALVGNEIECSRPVHDGVKILSFPMGVSVLKLSVERLQVLLKTSYWNRH